MSENGIKFLARAADGNLSSVQKFIAEHRNDELEGIDDVNWAEFMRSKIASSKK